MKKPAIPVLWISFLFFIVIFPCLCPAQAVANKQAVLSQARRSYYNLRNEGLSAFECRITPNWDTLLKAQIKDEDQSPEARDERQKTIQTTVETLSQIHFNVALASDNSVKLTHNELSGQTRFSGSRICR